MGKYFILLENEMANTSDKVCASLFENSKSCFINFLQKSTVLRTSYKDTLGYKLWTPI